MSDVPLAANFTFRGPVANFDDAAGYRQMAAQAGAAVRSFRVRHRAAVEHQRRVVVGANGQPALAAYLPDERGDCRGYGIMVLDIANDAIVAITGFPDAALFAGFGLPTTRSPT